MAFSNVEYQGDGSNRNFSVPFPYLVKSHVQLLVNGIPVAFTWLTSAMLQAADAPAQGDVVLVKRVTPTDQLVDFSDGSTLVETDLDLSALQPIFIAQETLDQMASKIGVDEATGAYDVQGRRMTNLADPVNPQDAMTYRSAATSIAEAAAQATQAGTARTGAEAAKAGAETARAGAETARDVALGHRNAAAQSATNAATSEAGALAHKNAAEAAAQQAGAHTHPFTAITGVIADAQLPNQLRDWSLNNMTRPTDLNTATQNGWYVVTDTCLNVPTAGEWWFVNYLGDANYGTQYATGFGSDTTTDSRKFKREINNGTWTSWYRVRENEAELDARYAQLAALSDAIPVGSVSVFNKVVTGLTGWIATGGYHLQSAYPKLFAKIGIILDAMYGQGAKATTSTNQYPVAGPSYGIAPPIGSNRTGIYVAAKYNLAQVIRSTDFGFSWNSYSTPTALNQIVWSGTQFVATVFNQQTNNLYTSPDGLTWTLRTAVLPSVGYWNCLARSFDGSRLCAVSHTGVVATSDDHGLTWAHRGDAGAAVGVKRVTAVGPNGFFFSCSTGQYHSPDGIAWTKTSEALPGGNVGQVCGSPTGRLLGVGAANNSTWWNKNDIIYSDNGGANWSKCYTHPFVNSVAGNVDGGMNWGLWWSSGRFVGVYATSSFGSYQTDLGSPLTATAFYGNVGDFKSLNYDGSSWDSNTSNFVNGCPTTSYAADDGRVLVFGWYNNVGGQPYYCAPFIERTYDDKTQFYVPPSGMAFNTAHYNSYIKAA